MTITLTVDATTLALSDDLRWLDEAEWSPVEQAVDRSITGALIVQTAQRTASTGRPITLGPPDDAAAWMPRATLDQLLTWAAIPGQTLALSLRGALHAVMFRLHEPPAIQADPVVWFSDEGSTDWYRITLKLMKV